MSDHALQQWHLFAETSDPKVLDALLADDAVFYSPVVHTPQAGKALTAGYLNAASAVFFGGPFKYVGQWRSDDGAVLEFTTEIDGIEINGIDIIRWNDDDKIVEFKVFIRPLKAVNLIHQKMKAMLEAKRA